MALSITGWTAVREDIPQKNSEESYIRNSDIQRISIKENLKDGNFPVYIFANGNRFLYTNCETDHEARHIQQELVKSLKDTR